MENIPGKQDKLKHCHTALTNQSGLTGTKAYINNQEIMAYFDTGVEISIMSHKIANKYNFKVYPTNIKVKTADNTITDAIGETDYLNIQIADSTCPIKFIVFDHDDHPILLGLDWFNISDASINPSRNTIHFNSKTYFLNTATIITDSQLNTVDDDPEGRLEALMVEEDNIDNIGFCPDDEKKEEDFINIKTEIKLDEDLQKRFDVELVPLIKESCIGLGKYNGDEMIIEVTSNQPVTDHHTEDHKQR
jgi:hypothetical protein